MYSKIAQNEGELDENVSTEYTKLYHDHRALERSVRRLRLSLGLCSVLFLVMLVYSVGSSSLGAKLATGSQKPSPVRESEETDTPHLGTPVESKTLTNPLTSANRGRHI